MEYKRVCLVAKSKMQFFIEYPKYVGSCCLVYFLKHASLTSSFPNFNTKYIVILFYCKHSLFLSLYGTKQDKISHWHHDDIRRPALNLLDNTLITHTHTHSHIFIIFGEKSIVDLGSLFDRSRFFIIFDRF